MDQKLNRRLASGAVSLLLLGGVMFLLLPSSGANEFRAMDQALRNARSWRSHLVAHEPGRWHESKIEVYCPDRIHAWNQMIEEGKIERRIVENETLDVGDTRYTRVPRGWRRTVTGRPGSGTCLWGPRGVDEQLGQLDWVVRMGKIRDTGKNSLSGVPCRNWTGSLPTPGGWRDAWVVCIGADHLPLEIRTPDGSQVTTYSDWNQPILISPPPQEEIVAPES